MKILFVGRILRDCFLKTNEIKPGGNVLNVASFLSSKVNPKNIDLISAIDRNDEIITSHINKIGINLYNIVTTITPLITYDENNKMKSVDLYNLKTDFNVNTIKVYEEVIKAADMIVADLGDKEIVEYLLQVNPKACLVIEPISKYNIANLSPLIMKNLSLIKFNREEVSEFTKIKIKGLDDLVLIEDKLKSLKIKRAFITLDKDGVYYFDQHERNHLESRLITNKNLVGAGDAFLAGIIYALRITKDINILADYGNLMVIENFK